LLFWRTYKKSGSRVNFWCWIELWYQLAFFWYFYIVWPIVIFRYRHVTI
jgi:hypothetical protein